VVLVTACQIRGVQGIAAVCRYVNIHAWNGLDMATSLTTTRSSSRQAAPRARVGTPRKRSRARAKRVGWGALRHVPKPLRFIMAGLLLTVLALAVNWAYQVARKPSELLFPVSGALNKTPAETWNQYAPIFKRYSTRVISPELLAAMAQVEASGNPLARTYWRWSWSVHPFEVYRPASSAVGTFAEAKRYCIVDHRAQPCAFGGLYSRIMPSHAVELAAAYLDRSVALGLERHGLAGASLQHRQQMAIVAHLCGAGAGDVYAKRGFRLSAGQRCGDQDVRAYLGRVNAMKRVFERLARSEPV
jgi:hypothetical protein